MIYITRSHNLTILSGALADKLTETAPVDPFISQKIIVPNLDTARWFKLFAAEKNGIAANLECMLPAEWVWRQIRKIYPDLPELLPSDLQPMKWSLFELLSDENVQKKFSLIDRYIRSQPEEKREQVSFQLGGQIASVFDEYLVYRPEMILRWQKGHSGKGDEKWQAELWRTLNDSWKRSNAKKIVKNRAELYDEVMSGLANNEIETDDYLYVLNPGLLPLPVIKMLNKIGEQSNIFIYQIQLSKVGGKNINELSQVFGEEWKRVEEVINFLKPDETINLHPEVSQNRPVNQIQSDIVKGNTIGIFSGTDDGIPEIEIRSCHSPLREIEVLHQYLLEKFEEDETLQPDDILVAAPDLETYRPYIKAVFDQPENLLPEIPYYAGYSKRSSDAGIERTLLRLLSLVESRFEFAGVIDLFMMKSVYQSFGVSESDCNKLRRWVEENHVVWGLNAEHRKEFGQPAEELQTWNSALRRGWYGHLLGGKTDALDGDPLLYQAIQTTNDQQVWAAFSNYMHQLDGMRKEVKRKKTCTGWAEWLTDRMEFLFGGASGKSQEAQGIRRIIGQINEHSETAKCDTKIPFSLFKSELTSMLDRQKASGALFTNGITFSSMVPVRSMPFKVIALIGLNENTFPRKQITPDFDLIAQNPLPGERNRKNEDRNLFLESVMAAGDIHYCSYIGQSQVDNEEIPPSTIVSEWADVLSKASGIDAKNIIKKEALSGFSPVNFESKKSYSEINYQTAKNLLDDADSVAGLKLNEAIPLEEPEESIQLDDLIRFYSNPIRWFMRNRLEVFLRETEREKDEFALDHLEKHILFRRVFGWVLEGASDQQIQKYLVQSGAVPVGWPGERKVLDLKRNVDSAISAMNDAGIHPRLGKYPVVLSAGENEIEGNLTSYSDRQFVDVTPSDFSGKIAINSWIQHLCGLACSQFERKNSFLFCELKGAEPKKKVFGPVQNPNEVLTEWVDFYKEGLIKPQTFFPKTLFAFEERERGEKKTGSYQEAAKAFNTDDYSFGENNDPAIKTFLGQDVEFQTKFITARYRSFIQQMMDHMEEA